MPGSIPLSECQGFAIGISRGAGQPRGRAVAFRRWTAEDDFEIGKLVAAHKNDAMSDYCVEVVRHFASVWGEVDCTLMKPHERLLAISQSYAPDFLTAWCLLRRAAMGNAHRMELGCECQHRFVYEIDLGSLEIVTAPDDEDPRRVVALSNGLTARGQTFRVVAIEPVRWSAYATLPKWSQNPAALKLLFCQHSIVAAGGEMANGEASDLKSMSFSFEEIRGGLSKLDLERLFGEISAFPYGPNLEIDVECPECFRRINASISWSYVDFFSMPASSPSRSTKPSFARPSPSATTPKEGSPST